VQLGAISPARRQWVVQLSHEIARVAVGGVLLRPRLAIGVTQLLGDSSPSITGRLASAPNDIDPFSLRHAPIHLNRRRQLPLPGRLQSFRRTTS
jgi:hypothetical protein